MRGWLLLALVATSGCSGDKGVERRSAPHGLEAAAIAAGVIEDPANGDPIGPYARDTDRICVVPTRSGYRIGVFVDYGDDQHCAASGTLTGGGETRHLELGGSAGCSFDARFEGDRIVFPGRMPEGCQALCQGRASLAGVAVTRLSNSVSEATTLRDSHGRLLCGND